MNFCTIVTPNYIQYALALRESLKEYHDTIHLYIFVSEFKEGLKQKVEKEFTNTFVIFPMDICKNGPGKVIYDKYANSYMDGFRWSIKPVLLMHLLQMRGINKVIYVDCDIHFYSDYQFLFNELDENNILLTPHWRTSDPLVDEVHFFELYTSGIYNAGFIGANSKAVEALDWWAKANLFVCEINPAKGQYVDQSHLNLLPIYFDCVKSLKHRGCNVAGWNIIECKRTLKKDGTVLINNKWPIVFIHFSNHTIQLINNNEDKLLEPHLSIYIDRVSHFANKMKLKPITKQVGTTEEKMSTKLIAKIKNKVKRTLNQQFK